MRPSFFVGLVVAAGAALFGLCWLVSDPAPGEAPSQTAVEVRAGEQLALASGSWSASSADAATEFMPPTIKSERSPIEPESVAATESANVLHVIDESGAPLPDAELAAFVEDFTSWTRLEADEDGDIELPGDLPDGMWFVGAPGLEVLPLWELASPVVLRPTPPVRVQGVDAMGEPVAPGWRVRLIETEFNAACMSWLSMPSLWQPLIDGQVQLNPTIRWGTQDTQPMLEFESGAACTWIQNAWDYDWDDGSVETSAGGTRFGVSDPATGFEEAVVCQAFVQTHQTHALPVVRFVDADGSALGDRRVQIRLGLGLLRETRTGAVGDVAIDFHMSARVEGEETIELRIEDRADHWESAWVRLESLRAVGAQTFQFVTRSIRVRLSAADPQAFSVAWADDALLMHDATDVQSKLSAHQWHSNTLSFEPFGADGWALLPASGFVGPGCVVLRHDALGLLVDLQSILSGSGSFETPVTLVAPELGLLKLKGTDWLEPNEWITLTPMGSDWPLKPIGGTSIHRGKEELMLPNGVYAVRLEWHADRSLTVSSNPIKIGTEPVTLQLNSVWESVPKRTVMGHVKCAFPEMPMGGMLLKLETPWLRENWSGGFMTEVLCDANGDFEMDIPGGPNTEPLAFWLDIQHPKTSLPIKPTWIDATHFELDAPLGCLEVDWPEGAVLPGTTLELELVDQSSPRIRLEPSDPISWRYMPSGRYRIQYAGDADEHAAEIELLPGERRTYVVPEPTFGLVSFRIKAPQDSSVLVVMPSLDGEAEEFVADISDVGKHNVALPESHVVQAGTYQVELTGEWKVDDLVLVATSTMEFTVVAGQAQQVSLDLSLPFREQASQALAEHPKSREKLNAYLRR
jgi:hypothetical protein